MILVISILTNTQVTGHTTGISGTFAARTSTPPWNMRQIIWNVIIVFHRMKAGKISGSKIGDKDGK